MELFCDATATPEPRVTWRKDDQEMTSSERVRVTPTRVKIRDADRKDGGAYTCTFRNAVGHVSHTIKLVIEGQSRDRKRSTAYLLTGLLTGLPTHPAPFSCAPRLRLTAVRVYELYLLTNLLTYCVNDDTEGLVECRQHTSLRK